MHSILSHLEQVVQAEFGQRDLAAVRAAFAERMQDADRLPEAAGAVMAFVEAVAHVRRRPVHEVYQFLALKAAPLVLPEHAALLKGHTSSRSVLMQVTRLAPSLLEAAVPGAPYAEFDVELLDLETMRVRFDGSAEMLAAFEGVVAGMAQHFGERAEMTRVSAPAFAPDRRMVDIKVGSERRAMNAPAKAPFGQEFRKRTGL